MLKTDYKGFGEFMEKKSKQQEKKKQEHYAEYDSRCG